MRFNNSKNYEVILTYKLPLIIIILHHYEKVAIEEN